MIEDRLKALRTEMQKHDFAGYIVSSSDEYLSEYTPDYAKRLEYITGFTGSNGFVVILQNQALFFTDGRYITQSMQELDPQLFSVYNLNQLKNFAWDSVVESTKFISYDPKLFTENQLKSFACLNLKPCTDNFIDHIWYDQPDKPNSSIYEYPTKYAGQASTEKINQCQKVIAENHAEALLLTDASSVCWLLNIRASDVEFSPLLLANMIITCNTCYLFTDINRLQESVSRQNLEILPESKLAQVLSQINGIVLFDQTQCSSYIISVLQCSQSQHLINPCMLWKSCKNNTEISCIKEAHILDAVAVCELLNMIVTEDTSNITEYDIGVKLTEYRQKGQNYVCDSFPTICGFQENGAIIHYRAHQSNAKYLIDNGLLLIDSGGQYMGATTDITRTVLIGKKKQNYKDLYTRVLKGHIALANIKFPANKVNGAHLDILARQYLWQQGLDYAHGTGHGVGSFLSVHEGPQNISPVGYGVNIQVGMVLSNEPGYYLPKQMGIRIENLMYAKESNINGFVEFEPLTLVPYARELINVDMLNQDELNYLKSYYQMIYQSINDLLSDSTQRWLESQIGDFIR